jgi:hypothetical protein
MPPSRPRTPSSDASADGAGAAAGVHARRPARRASSRQAARRLTTVAVAAALLTAAVATALATAALHQPISAGLLDFGVFGGLAAVTAGVLTWELVGNRYCPRCGHENRRKAALCAACAYDLATRPRFACSEGHRLAYEPGMCQCGRRLLALRAPDVGRHALNSVVLALACFLGLLVIAQLIVGR